MKTISSIFLSFCLFTQIVNAYDSEEFSSITHSLEIDRECAEVVASDEKFSNFRRLPFCLGIVDTVNADLGWQYFHYIRMNYPDLHGRLSDFHKNDQVGNPILERFRNYGYFCPTTLRYVKISGDLKAMFGDLNNKTVIEIGGGYGGQCSVLSTQFAFKEYIIVDLPEVLLLTKEYLNRLGITNVRFVSPDQITSEMFCDVVISNFAFSECSYHTQKDYMQKILKNAKKGYMICNDFGSFKSNFPEFFKNANTSVQVLQEEPLSSPANYLIAWTPSTSN